MTFKQDPKNTLRSEDALIAYAWDQFFKTKDPQWLPRFPMTKSAVRAMDTLSDYLAQPAQGKLSVDHFVVAGLSKRGWTTWTTGAVDPRVVAIVPIVIDLLNAVPSFKHHYRVYGFFSSAVKDYQEFHIFDQLDTPQFKQLLSFVEPYELRSHLTPPKYIMNATGDPFFLPDSSQYYFDDLPGEKYLRYVPNTDHAIFEDSPAAEDFIAFYDSVLTGESRPQIQWKNPEAGVLEVQTSKTPTSLKIWSAHNPKARDFRKETIGAAWQSTDLPISSTHIYVAHVPLPKEGWTAFFVECSFVRPSSYPLKVTTSVYVVPTQEPYADYVPPTQGNDPKK